MTGTPTMYGSIHVGRKYDFGWTICCRVGIVRQIWEQFDEPPPLASECRRPGCVAAREGHLMTAAKATHVTACCGPVPAGDASEHLVHRLLLALATHPDGATFDQLLSTLGNVPTEALTRRLVDFVSTGLASAHAPYDQYRWRWALTDRGRERAESLGAHRWPSSHLTPTAAPTAAPEPKPT